MLLRLLLMCAVVLPGAVRGASAETAVLHVRTDAQGSATGLTWRDAFTDLNDALHAAERLTRDGHDVEIRVAAGTYRPAAVCSDCERETDRLRDATFPLRNNVAIYGGFAGDELTHQQRDPARNLTVLCGMFNDYVRANHVVTAINVDRTAVLDGVVIANGCAQGGPGRLDGGAGLLLMDASAVIRHCHVRENRAAGDGAAVYVQGGMPLLINCRFESNVAARRGGAIHAERSGIELRNCGFAGNASLAGGGAVSISGGQPMMLDSRFVANASAAAGGALHTADASLLMSGSSFMFNQAQAGGAALSAVSGSVSMQYCQIVENASELGAAISADCELNLADTLVHANAALGIEGAGTIHARRCAITGNGGGGIAWRGEQAVFINCTVLDNITAFDGGGIDLQTVSARIGSSLVAFNEADLSGGGLRVHTKEAAWIVNCTVIGNALNDGSVAGAGVAVAGEADMQLVNCILWDNGGPRLSDQIAGPATVRSSCIQGLLSDDRGNVGMDPMFADAFGRLSADSPCVDAGESGEVLSWISHDLDGQLRIADGLNDGLLRVDMGAFELHHDPASAGSHWAAAAWRQPLAGNALLIINLK